MKRLAAAGVLAFCLFPAAALFSMSLGDAGWREVLAAERSRGLLWRSLGVSGGAAGLALLWGVLVAAGVRAARGVLASGMEALAFLPLLVPPIVSAMGWIYFLGPNGPVARWFPSPPDIYTPGCAAFLLSLAYFPCVAVLLLQGLRNLDPAWTAIGRMHAGTSRTFVRVTLPLLAPYLAGGVLLVFLLALADYGIPSALTVNVYPVEVFTSISAYFDLPRAVAACAPMVAVALAALLLRTAAAGPVRPTVGIRSRLLAGSRARVWILPALGVFVLAFGLPVSYLVVKAGSFASLTDAYRIAGDNVLYSLRASLVGTVMLMGTGLVMTEGFARTGRAPRRLLQGVILLPLVIPGSAIALGILTLVNRGWIPQSVAWSDAMLGYGFLCRWVTVPVLVLLAARAAILPRMEEAAAVAGRGPGTIFGGITVPLLAPGLLAAGVLSFLFCFGELSISVLLTPAGRMTLPARVASLLHFGEDRIVSGLCLTLLLFATGIFTVGLLLLGPRTGGLDARRA